MPSFVGPTEIILLLVLALLLFGAKRLPEIGRSMGRGMREFKDSVSGNVDYDDDGEPRPRATATRELEPPVGTQDTTAPAPARERDAV